MFVFFKEVEVAKPNSKRISVNVRLDDELLRWVERKTKKLHCNMSQVIRNLIVQAISEEKGSE